MENETKLSIGLIKVDGGTQTREALNRDVVAEYAEAMLEGADFPPVVVYYDGSDYWLADGFHRYAAHRFLRANTHREFEQISAIVRQGHRRDAVLFSVGANANHGLRRTNADKRRAVETLLMDPEWSKWSDREIARKCGVNNSMVSRMRAAMPGQDSDTERQYVTKHGTVATMQTGNIGTTSSDPESHTEHEKESEPAKVDDRPFYEPEYDPSDEDYYEPEPNPVDQIEDHEDETDRQPTAQPGLVESLDAYEAVKSVKGYVNELLSSVSSDSDKAYVLTVCAYWMDEEKKRIEGGAA
jgi:hypothetical protein